MRTFLRDNFLTMATMLGVVAGNFFLLDLELYINVAIFFEW